MNAKGVTRVRLEHGWVSERAGDGAILDRFCDRFVSVLRLNLGLLLTDRDGAARENRQRERGESHCDERESGGENEHVCF